MENEWARMLWAQTWQVSLLILIVAAVTRWLGRNHPHFAHILWVVVLVKAMTPPLWSSPSGLFTWLQPPRSSGEAAPAVEPAEPPPAPEPKPSASPTIANQLLEQDWPASAEPLVAAENEDEIPAGVVLEAAVSTDVSRLGPAISEEPVPSAKPGPPLGIVVAMAVWLVGMLGALAVSLGRWIGCLREIHRAGVVEDHAAQRLLEELSARLKVRRNVRLIISRSRIGPAVLGIFRPMVLIPHRIIAGQRSMDLEPILAHELIHVRRGDLWVGWLQVLVAAVWWFHPLVWWAGRKLKHEAERCCDEEVIAELGLKPARYARALLDVLELKHVLRPVPVLPGVKPVEITSKRMERIMLLGQGCRKRTPWWCWLIMLITAALTLPGAAFVAQGKDKPNRTGEQEPKSPFKTKTFKVGDVLEQFRTEFGFQTNAKARFALAELLKNTMGEHWQEESLRTSEEQAAPSIAIKGNTLRVRHTPRVLEKIAEELEILRKHGFAQIVIEARILSAGADVIEKAVSNWNVLPSDVPEDLKPESRQKAGNSVRSITEKSAPMRLATLDEAQLKNLIETCQSDLRSNIMFCPKVTVFNGQHATIQDTVQRPFVVGISAEGQPAIRLVSEGIHMKLRPVLEGDRIRLESQLTFSDIKSVEVMTLPAKPGEDSPQKVQVPEVTTLRINTTVKVPDGGSVLLGGLKLPEEKEASAGGNGILQTLGLAEKPRKQDRQLFVVLRVVHLKDDVPDVEVRYAQKAFEIAELEYRKALEANRRLEGTVPELDVERLRLKSELAHLKVEEAKHESELRKRQTGRVILGQGVNSDAGLAGQVTLDEKNFETIKIEPPTDEEVLKAVRKESKSIPFLSKSERKNVRIIKEKVFQSAEPPRFYPLLGQAVKCTAKFKCTMTSELVQSSEWPVPMMHTGEVTDIVNIDKTVLVPVKKTSQPLPAPPAPLFPTPKDASVGKAEFLDRLRTNRQVGIDKNSSLSVAEVRGNTLIKPTLQCLGHDGIPVKTQAKTGTIDFDQEKQQFILHLEQGQVEMPGSRAWFEKLKIPFSIPRDVMAPTTSPEAARPPHQDGQVKPSAYYLEDDIQYFPQPAPTAKAIESWNDLVRSKRKPSPNEVKRALAGMVNEYNELFEQKRYADAEALAKKAMELDPENPTAETMYWKARFARRNARNEEFQTKKEEGFIRALESAERAATPVDDNRNEADKNIQIEKSLTRLTSLHFKNTPLSEVLKHIVTDAGFNIVVDNLGLAEAGIKPDQAITIDVEEIKLSSALQLILKPLELGYMVQDQVLKITSKDRVEHRPIVVITYPVADLIVSVPQKVMLDLREQAAKVEPGEKKEPNRAAAAEVPRADFDFDSLSQLITTTIEPDTWSERGGIGQIRGYETTLSLVVRQSERVHEQIRDLLEQLRRLQDSQVVLSIQTIDGGKLEDRKLTLKLLAETPVALTPSDAEALKASFLDQAIKPVSFPKVTLYNGQMLNLVLPGGSKDGLGLDLSPVVSPDRRFVRLGLSLGSEVPKNQQTGRRITLKDRHSVLMDLSRAAGKRNSDGSKLVLITARIIVEEEEEELLAPPTKVKNEKPVSVIEGKVGTVAPRILVQEEDEKLLGIEVK